MERPAKHATAAPLTRLCGVAVPGGLVALAGLHAAWALGSPWPAASERELAEHVLSQRERDRLDGGLPPAYLTWAVAIGLLGAAALVRSVATGSSSRTLRRAAWAISGLFLGRGVAYIPSDVVGGPNDTYERLDLKLYSPLCLALGAGTAIVARG